MERQQELLAMVMVGVLGLLVGAGCDKELKTASPSYTPYRFMKKAEYGSSQARLLQSVSPNNREKLQVCITEPSKQRVTFPGSGYRSIKPELDSTPVMFPNGIYKFRLSDSTGVKKGLCGAMLVGNVDQASALATFGLSKETKLFSNEMIQKAKEGILASYTIEFDNRPVIKYWLGNRVKMSTAGKPTIELDFSGISGIQKLSINGREKKSKAVVLTIYTTVERQIANPYSPGETRTVIEETPITYRVEIVLKDGRAYEGYLKDLRANAYTTFVRVVCAVPESLFKAADLGTVSKYEIHPAENPKSPVAVLMFGKKR